MRHVFGNCPEHLFLKMSFNWGLHFIMGVSLKKESCTLFDHFLIREAGGRDVAHCFGAA
jgi:hypothetical protein